MRKLLKNIIIFPVLLALSACEVEFDFKDLDSDPLLLLDGSVKTDSSDPGTGNFQMYIYAVPSAAGNREFSEDDRCTLKVYRNSELIDTKDYITIEPFYGLIPGDYPVSPGDEIRVTAESEGFPTASAASIIPGYPPAVEASCTRSGDNLKICFSFEDGAGTEDSYAFCFMTTSQRYGRPDYGTLGTSLDLSFGTSPESSFLDIGPFDITWEDGLRYYGIADTSFNGQRKEFEVTAPAVSAPVGETLYFRLEIQRVSPERLRYEIACKDKSSNILGFIGLAPVTFAYTNVAGGSGCFSTANAAYTPWQPVSDGE